MSIEDNKSLVNNYTQESLAVTGDMSRYDALVEKYLTPDCIIHMSGTDLNVEQFKAVGTYISNAISNIGITIDDIVAERDKVVVRTTFSGTHTGEYLGVAPTGKKFAQNMMTIYRIAGGKIAEGWALGDTLSMMIQVGAIPNPYPQLKTTW